jgi:glutamine synthetase
MVKRLSELSAKMYKNLSTLEKAAAEAKSFGDIKKQANYYRDSVIPAMNELRAPADEIESLVGEKYWPYPTYGALLFYVM